MKRRLDKSIPAANSINLIKTPCVFIPLILILLAVVAPKYTYAQSQLSTEVVDTSPIELYLEMADQIKNDGRLDDALVRKYFSNPAVALFTQRPGFDSVKFVNSLTAIYLGKPITEAEKDSDYELMLKYKQHESIIRRGVEQVKKTDIEENVKMRLKPFYPASLNLDSIQLHFVYMFIDEGNGGLPGYIFNSALQTAYLDRKNIDIISSHEAYHSINSSIFMDKYKRLFERQSDDAITNEQNLLWYLEIVSEEGIADLIDKKILSAGNSPLAEEIQKLRMNEATRSAAKIHQLDSLLSDSSGQLNFLTMNNIIENGGHIPGRYMAEKIRSGNLLKEYIKHTGNPFQFFYFYNEAVKSNASAPRFSAKSISNLKALENKISKL